ncbi:nucleotidyltransferase substrate binding protein (TIGR01987 family) [Algoriphagus boseongensis]|uniref:Nucleotidyltransferase substrate binding protein (TIGR01987 family) n=1 Tax=Algoriphagus boseongensis TaxID=1442587 RepID=A0A4R6T4L9_9BACT|nr:nucleotidyltransferase substrate binding protein [Algoriphagus boseongensis]TDQ16395.1 nucleotidyltransferase substrate binding protein (TIGR01987 family) [Algoriphagus boseongensis]
MKTLPQSCEQCLKEFSLALEDLKIYSNRAKKLKTPEASRELIINFEITHELALKLISKYFHKMGKGPFSGSRDTTVEAFHAELIDDGKTWLDMVIDRIQYNPVYELDTQTKFLDNIQHKYIEAFEKFEDTMEKKLVE